MITFPEACSTCCAHLPHIAVLLTGRRDSLLFQRLDQWDYRIFTESLPGAPCQACGLRVTVHFTPVYQDLFIFLDFLIFLYYQLM